MKANIIRKLAEECELDELCRLQECIENEEALHRDVEGEDEGEKLTHILGAIWVREQMQKNNSDLKTEWRNFCGRVRNSIS